MKVKRTPFKMENQRKESNCNFKRVIVKLYKIVKIYKKKLVVMETTKDR